MIGAEAELFIFLDEDGNEYQFKVNDEIVDSITETGGSMIKCQIDNTTIVEFEEVYKDTSINN